VGGAGDDVAAAGWRDVAGGELSELRGVAQEELGAELTLEHNADRQAHGLRLAAIRRHQEDMAGRTKYRLSVQVQQLRAKVTRLQGHTQEVLGEVDSKVRNRPADHHAACAPAA
jgi:hypothetical protein